MAYQLIRDFIPSSKYNLKCPYAMTPIGYTVHNTYNDAPAENEGNYMENNSTSTSFHVVIDNVKVIEKIPQNRNAFHAGDGKYGTGNRKTIGVEICYSKSGGAKFDQAEINAAEYIAKGLKEHGWGIDKVYRHYDWSGKYCPHRTMDKGWNRFKNMIQAELDKLNGSGASSAEVENTNLDVDGQWGKATTLRLQEIFGTTKDGVVSNQWAMYKDDNPGLTTGWDWDAKANGKGSALIKAMQKYADMPEKDRDGEIGPKTFKAFQKKWGTYADGVISKPSNLVKALQKWSNNQ